MQNRYTLPLLSALVVAISLSSCQHEEQGVLPLGPSSSPDLWFEVSESPMGGETKAAPATIETFTTSHESFGVVGYAYASASPSTKTKDASGAVEVSYVSERSRWEPATPVGYSFAGNLLEFYAWYPYNVTTVPVTAPSSIDGTTHPTIAYTVPSDVADQKDLLVAVATSVTDSPAADTPVQLTFGHKLVAVRFSIGTNTTCSSITLSGIPGTGTLDMSTGEWSSVGTPATYTITSPTFGSADANGQCPIGDEFTLMLIPQTLPSGAALTAETSAGPIIASLAGQVWEAGKAVTYKLTTPTAPPSFSVSDTKKVSFSPGNLQAVFADAGTSFTWQFAENQWDYVGDAAANTSVNGNGSVSAAGTVDQFGWSTAATKYGIHNSNSNGTYSGDFVDWGTDSGLIAALGSGWRTLSSAEWTYLLNTRTGNRYCKATVNGVAGMVVFPDDYAHPSGVTVPASVNTSGAAFTSNTWSETDWTKMEAAGCVFLPAAGARNGSWVFNVGTDGGYWSSTPNGASDAYFLVFSSSDVNPANFSGRSYGYSVRLVRDLVPPTPTVFPFSVSSSQTVKFSPGNLQAVFAAAGNSFTWQFAENQWSYVGNAAANTSIDGDGSVSAAGTVDMFNWSTAATKYGIHDSTDEGTYSGDFVDWGSDSDLIAALGSGWRTLSSDEWTYLLETRDGDRYCKATVNGVAGMVVFPDDYVYPSGVTAPTSVNTPGAAFTSNSWSDAAWTAMEGAGCVFLPAAGYRIDTSVYGVGSRGCYWSSTPSGANLAYRLYFFFSDVSSANYDSRCSGISVRLVQNL